ncbi:MAG: 2,3,4,5-tetrahydropyridine-2,6-dicarboxylate N-succinyltransferase [Bdellovibrionaceae bacterium]|nr:2,3,4,5-tetrahydropyridine-2,6-dicarboxylate N-succinyltransferase [Bdellovibrionales bacterium]MCB9083419.1 2,3,4,5-tetrahydropyridine-2,6-dicarboxylate N-succinyltransferase [Pseudobdellovibrionaceae bacterium]
MQSLISQTFEEMDSIKKFDSLEEDRVEAIKKAVKGLDSGEYRVCTKEKGEWVTHQWLKQAILLFFKLKKMKTIEAGDFRFVDKIPLKKWEGHEGVRVVPHALVRQGAYISPGSILMPSYVNIGAWVGPGTMVDTWATVGSCAQIGANVHLSGGVGIGGVLEPVQASPVIVEDNVFVGSRCILVEGVVVEEGAVLGAGVTITSSTKIVDVRGSEPKVLKGRVPKNAVVIPGTISKEFPAGSFGVPAALIIGERSASTDKKTSLTEALRDFEVSV